MAPTGPSRDGRSGPYGLLADTTVLQADTRTTGDGSEDGHGDRPSDRREFTLAEAAAH